jgi:RNA polymerase sigma-70 factor, ECF subfamily
MCETSLLNAAVSGDRHAMDDLMEHSREVVRRVVRARLDRRIGKRVDADDVTQDILIEIVRRLHDYMQTQTWEFDRWIRQIAKDRIADAYRKHFRTKKRSVDREQHMADEEESTSETPYFIDTHNTPDQEVEDNETLGVIVDALDELREDDRVVITYRIVNGMTNQETATQLGITEPAACMRYHRAVQHLRQLVNV